jgi:hypothetical protein
MILGMPAFTAVHVLLSLLGIGSGLVVLWGLCSAKPMNGWTALFLASTLATSLTGFFFPFHGFTPGLAVGVLSTAVLIPTLSARYLRHLRGAWRGVYVVGAVVAFYFNAFVLVVQSFLKISALHALAPTGSEPAFVLVQAVVLLFCFVAGLLAIRRFHPGALPTVPG